MNMSLLSLIHVIIVFLPFLFRMVSSTQSHQNDYYYDEDELDNPPPPKSYKSHRNFQKYSDEDIDEHSNYYGEDDFEEQEEDSQSQESPNESHGERHGFGDYGGGGESHFGGHPGYGDYGHPGGPPPPFGFEDPGFKTQTGFEGFLVPNSWYGLLPWGIEGVVIVIAGIIVFVIIVVAIIGLLAWLCGVKKTFMVKKDDELVSRWKDEWSEKLGNLTSKVHNAFDKFSNKETVLEDPP